MLRTEMEEEGLSKLQLQTVQHLTDDMLRTEKETEKATEKEEEMKKGGEGGGMERAALSLLQLSLADPTARDGTGAQS